MFTDHDLVDLTLTLDERLPTTWPPHVPFLRHIWNWFEDVDEGPHVLRSHCGPYFTEALLLDEHIGTHFDAPAHFVEKHAHTGSDPITGDMVDVRVFCGAAAVIGVTAVEERGADPGASPFITKSDVETWEQQHRALRAGDIVLFRTGWDRHYTSRNGGRGYAYDVAVLKQSPGWPAPDVDCMRHLLDRGVRCVGTDGPSMGAAQDGGPVHVEGLGGGAVFIEGLAGLDQLPATGAHFQFLPLKISRSSGGPGRAVGWLPAAR